MSPPTSPSTPPTTPSGAAVRPSSGGKTFGRFELRKLIGKSDLSMVWLVHDPRPAQDLVLTLPRHAPHDDAALQRWLREARLALRLDHPRLASNAEVGVHERWPYLAVDRRHGICIVEWLASSARPAPAEAVGWLIQALEGLAFAHDAGASHGDLQLHSLLIDSQGSVRMAALATAGDSRQVLRDGAAPAALQAVAGVPPRDEPLRSHRESAERDVLAVGLLLHHLLAGQPALDEPDAGRVIERMTPHGRDMVRLPWATPHPVPEALRVIANRATANQERQRYLNARTLLRALQGWLDTESKDRGGPLALLIDRLRTVGHLPAMPGVTARVERLAGRDGQHTDAIADEILQDMALSFELLRLVNAPQVQNAQLGGAAPVLTIRRCVAMLGLNGVKNAAHGLRRWPGPLSDAGAAAMDKAVQLARLAGLTAQRLRPPGYDAEVVYLVAVLQNLGRLLVQYHFPDEAEQVRQLMLPAQAPSGEAGHGAQPGMSESAASSAVLGVDTGALGNAVMQHWGLGDEVLQMGQRLAPDRPVLAPDADADLLRITASAANDAVDAMTMPGTPQRKLMALSQIAQRYARVLELTPRDLQEALQEARTALQNGPGAVLAAARTGPSKSASAPRADDSQSPVGRPATA